VPDRSGDRRQLSFVRRWQKAIRVSDLPASARAIGWALSTWMDSEKGSCWPKHDSIADAAGTSVPTVRRGLLELERAGLIERSGRGARPRRASAAGQAHRRQFPAASAYAASSAWDRRSALGRGGLDAP